MDIEKKKQFVELLDKIYNYNDDSKEYIKLLLDYLKLKEQEKTMLLDQYVTGGHIYSKTAMWEHLRRMVDGTTSPITISSPIVTVTPSGYIFNGSIDPLWDIVYKEEPPVQDMIKNLIDEIEIRKKKEKLANTAFKRDKDEDDKNLPF